MTVILAAAAGLTLTALAAWCTTGSHARRAVGVILGVAVLLPPWLLPERPFLFRAIWAIAAFTTTMRVVDLARTEWPLRRRVAHVLSVVDSRRLVRTSPRFDVRAFARLMAWALMIAASVAALAIAPADHRAIPHVARWSAGVVLVYAAVSTIYDLLTLGYAATGFDTPPLHVAPIFARSVQELWGERWARPINEWLRETFFRPFARRRQPLVGLLLAFVVSAAFHAYAVWVGLGLVRGLTMAACMFAYFVAQTAVMLLERALHVARWPARGYAWAAHTWTFAWMLALAPLFIEPLVRVLDIARLPG